MKLVFHSPGHRKNIDGITLMCKSRGIELEFTRDNNRIQRNDYDILVMNDKYIDPTLIPSNIKIIYGPQHFTFPTGPLCGQLRSELVGRCVYNTLSTWVSTLYDEFSSLIVPHAQFPFAVDIERFAPSSVEKSIDCIIYIKHRSNSIINPVLEIINSKNLKTKIFRYGSYNEADYLETLQRSKFMISIDAHESQGFGLQEAMSSGVPLIVLDVRTMKEEANGDNHNYLNYNKDMLCTSVPYWDDRCGLKIRSIDELNDSIDKMVETYNTFRPREYITETLSPSVCMDKILLYFNLKTDL